MADQALFQAVEAYIQKRYKPERNESSMNRSGSSIIPALGSILGSDLGTSLRAEIPSGLALKGILDAVTRTTEKTFAERLMDLIGKSGKAPSEVYCKADISKQHFSKIKNHKDYQPTKETALAFAVALELSLDEAKALIGSAGYTLSRSSKRDLIVEYFLKERIYNVDEINDNLNARGLGTLTNRRNGL